MVKANDTTNTCGRNVMGGQDADRLIQLLERLVVACEGVAARLAEGDHPAGRGRRKPRQGSGLAGQDGPAEKPPLDALQLPPEVSTSQAAEILGVSKDTVLLYREKGLLPYRDLAPPGSTKPIYMYPLDAIIAMRTAYQTDQPAPHCPSEPPRRRAKGERRYKHLHLD